MLTVNFTNWANKVPEMDRDLKAAFTRALSSIPEGKEPTADKILEAAVKTDIWTMDQMVRALESFGVDVSTIEKVLAEKKPVVVESKPEDFVPGGPAVVASAPSALSLLKGKSVIDRSDGGEDKSEVKSGPMAGVVFSASGTQVAEQPAADTPVEAGAPTGENPAQGPSIVVQPRPFRPVPTTTTAAITKTEDEEPKNWKDRLTSWTPPWKKEEETPKPQTRTFGRHGSGGGSSDKKGNLNKWVFGVLALIILLIAGGVLWRLGNENGEYSSSEPSLTNLGLSACTTADGLAGVTRYNITPNQDIVGLSGFTDPQRNLPYVNTSLVFEQGKSYQAIIVGDNYRVGLSTDISVYAPVFSFTQIGNECVQSVAVEVLTSGIENQQRASVQLAYKIDFSHWSGVLVALSLMSILGFTAITLFMSGGKIKDFILMVVAVGGTAFFTAKSDWEPSTFFMFYVFIYILTVALGSKSELQEQSDSFNAGNQLKLPQSMETLFKSLTRGWGIVGGYDWSQSAIYGALIMFVGAVYPSASPLVRALDSQIMAIGVGGLFVVFSCAMEAWRRGLLGDWVAFGLGFIGLLDYGIYYSAFGTNPPNILDFSPTALAVVGWATTFILAVLANFGAQATSERTELQRDRMADGMLFFSAMKLVAILGYVFINLM